MALTVERCCEVVDAEIDRVVEVSSDVDPATPVPSCPGWTVADLLEHVGTVFRWAATMVRDSSQERLRREQMDWALPADPGGLPAWVAEGRGFVLEQFLACDPATPMWAWGWPKTAGFWPRRMVHEIGVHRADAELAVGIAPTFGAEVAADGVAELLGNLPHAEYFAPNVAELRGNGESMAWVAPDAAVTWRIELLPDRFEWSIADAPGADATVTAPAGQLLLAVYGRADDVSVTGDRALWDRWRANSAL